MQDAEGLAERVVVVAGGADGGFEGADVRLLVGWLVVGGSGA